MSVGGDTGRWLDKALEVSHLVWDPGSNALHVPSLEFLTHEKSEMVKMRVVPCTKCYTDTDKSLQAFRAPRIAIIFKPRSYES